MKETPLKSLKNRSSLFLALIWLFVVSTACWSILSHEKHEYDSIARALAETALNKDQAFRQWGSSHGGVYVPIDSNTPPNPYLEHVPERDITTPSGKSLTLMNPAYMVRQMNEEFGKEGETFTHITSLNPLRPENSPDKWEKKALTLFAEGQDNFSEYTSIDDKPYFRFMEAMITKTGCLKCHAHQEYKLGDIRGGVSISVPMEELLNNYSIERLNIFMWHGAIAMIGLFFILLGNRISVNALKKRDQAAKLLLASEEKFRTVADFTYAWEYWNNPDGSLNYTSPSVERITGYPASRFMDNPKFLETIVHPDDLPLFMDHFVGAHEENAVELDFRIIRADSDVRWIRHLCNPVTGTDERKLGRRASNYDITEQKQVEKEREESIIALKQALEKVKLLSGFLPICASCKKIRDDQGYWSQIESYIKNHSEAEFSHSICPDCAKKLYPDFVDDLDLK